MFEKILFYRKFLFSWNIFAAFLVFELTTTHADIRSYIRVCGRKDSNYDQCIVNNINNLKDKLCKGVPELNLSPIEPIVIDKIVIFQADNFKLYLKDAKLKRICDYTVEHVRTDSNRLHFDIEILFNRLIVDTEYDFDAHILVPLKNKGLISIRLDKPLIRISMDLKVVTKNGQHQIYASKINVNIKIPLFQYEFDDSEKDLVQLHQILNDFVDRNRNDIVTNVKSVFEKKIGQELISIFNNITRFNYGKLFPEIA